MSKTSINRATWLILFSTILAIFSIRLAFAVPGRSINIGSAPIVGNSTAQKLTGIPAPVRDERGRIRYIVDIDQEDTGRPTVFPDAASKIAWKRSKSRLLIDDVTRLLGIELHSSTSLVGTSFTAYLTEQQVKLLESDSRVRLITADVNLSPSALWANSVDASGQIRPWGLQAIGATGGGSGGSATVYVIDSGAELHSDIPGLSSADRIAAIPFTTQGQPVNPTGCFAHATHVAGIIGAGDNGMGVVGVHPGVRIVSIAVGDTNPNPCPAGSSVQYGSDGFPLSGIVQALEIVYERVLVANVVGIANLSINGSNSTFSSTGTVGSKMRFVATPAQSEGVGYKGTLIVQSAGNSQEQACLYAYNSPSSYDGIIVVGGIDENGQKVGRLNGLDGYVNGTYAGSDPGSNFGDCVEFWAPSQRIRSTWSGNAYASLSGTSMAAPYVAGLAARLLDSLPNINTSIDLESALSSHAVTILGSGLNIPQEAMYTPSARPTVEIVESGNRSSLTTINFSKFPNEINLAFDAIGASYCYLYVTRYGSYYQYAYLYPPFQYNLAAGYPSGQYVWSVTCYTPLGQVTTSTASGYVKRLVTLEWVAITTSTSGQPVSIPNANVVSWSVSANAPFDQWHSSTGADYCRVESFGFLGSTTGDPENPLYSPLQNFSPTLLWDSGYYFPTYYVYATFNYGDPLAAAPPMGPYNGYKWRLTCWNNDGDSKQTMMYGVPGP